MVGFIRKRKKQSDKTTSVRNAAKKTAVNMSKNGAKQNVFKQSVLTPTAKKQTAKRQGQTNQDVVKKSPLNLAAKQQPKQQQSQQRGNRPKSSSRTNNSNNIATVGKQKPNTYSSTGSFRKKKTTDTKTVGSNIITVSSKKQVQKTKSQQNMEKLAATKKEVSANKKEVKSLLDSAKKKEKESKKNLNVLQLKDKYGDFDLKNLYDYTELYKEEKQNEAQALRDKAQKIRDKEQSLFDSVATIKAPKVKSQEELVQENLKNWQAQKYNAINNIGNIKNKGLKKVGEGLTADNDVDYLNKIDRGRKNIDKADRTLFDPSKMSLKDVENEMLNNWDKYNSKQQKALNDRYVVLASMKDQVDENTTSDPNKLSDVEKTMYEEYQKSQQEGQQGLPDWNNYVSDSSVAMEELKQKGVKGADEAKAKLQLNDEYNIFKKRNPDMSDEQIYSYLATRDDYGKAFTELAKSHVKNQTVSDTLRNNSGNAEKTFDDIAAMINSNPDGPTEETQQLRKDTWEWAGKRAQELKEQGKTKEANELMKAARMFYDNTATTSVGGKNVQAFSSGLESILAGNLVSLGGMLGVDDGKLSEAEDAYRNARERQAISKLGVNSTLGKIGLDVMNVAGMQVPALVMAASGGGNVPGALARTAELSGMTMTALGAGGQQYVNAIDEGATEAEAVTTGIINGFLEGALFKLPMKAIVKKTPSQLKAEAAKALQNNTFAQYALKHIGRAMGYEALEEGTTAFLEEAVNEAVYADNIGEMGFGEWLKQTGKQSLYEGFIGGLFGFGAGAVTARANYNNDMSMAFSDTLKTQSAKDSATGAEANADTSTDGAFTTEGLSETTSEYMNGAEKIADEINSKNKEQSAAAEVAANIVAENLNRTENINEQQNGSTDLKPVTLDKLNAMLKTARKDGNSNLEADIRSMYTKMLNGEENIQNPQQQPEDSLNRLANNNISGNAVPVEREIKKSSQSKGTAEVENNQRKKGDKQQKVFTPYDVVAEYAQSDKAVKISKEQAAKKIIVEENQSYAENKKTGITEEPKLKKTEITEKPEVKKNPIKENIVKKDKQVNSDNKYTTDSADFAKNGIVHKSSLTDKVIEVAKKRVSQNKSKPSNSEIKVDDLAGFSDREIMDLDPKTLSKDVKDEYTKRMIGIYNKRQESIKKNGKHGVSGWFNESELSRLFDNDLSKIDIKAQKDGYVRANIYYTDAGVTAKTLRDSLKAISKDGTDIKPINIPKGLEHLERKEGGNKHAKDELFENESALEDLVQVYASGLGMGFSESENLARKMNSLRMKSKSEFEKLTKQYYIPYFLKDGVVDINKTASAIRGNSNVKPKTKNTEKTNAKRQITMPSRRQQEIYQNVKDIFALNNKSYRKKYNRDKNEDLDNILSEIYKQENDFGASVLGRISDNGKKVYKARFHKEASEGQDIWSSLAEKSLVPQSVEAVTGKNEIREFLKEHSLSELDKINSFAKDVNNLSKRIRNEYENKYGILKNNNKWLSSLIESAKYNKDSELLLNFLENYNNKVLKVSKFAKNDKAINLVESLKNAKNQLNVEKHIGNTAKINELKTVIKFLKSHIEQKNLPVSETERRLRSLISAEEKKGYQADQEKLEKWYNDLSFYEQYESQKAILEQYENEPMEVIYLTPQQYNEYLRNYEGLLFTASGKGMSSVDVKIPFAFVEPSYTEEGSIEWESYEPETYGKDKIIAKPGFVAVPRKVARELEHMMEQEEQKNKDWKQRKDWEYLQKASWIDAFDVEKFDYVRQNKDLPDLSFDAVKKYAKEYYKKSKEEYNARFFDDEDVMLSYLKDRLHKNESNIDAIKAAVNDDKVTFNSIQDALASSNSVDNVLTFDKIKQIYATKENPNLFDDFDNNDLFVAEMKKNPDVVNGIVRELLVEEFGDKKLVDKVIASMEQKQLDKAYDDYMDGFLRDPDEPVIYTGDIEKYSLNQHGSKKTPETDEYDNIDSTRYRIIERGDIVGPARPLSKSEEEFLAIFRRLSNARGSKVVIKKNYTDNYSNIYLYKDGHFTICISPKTTNRNLFKSALVEEYLHSFENNEEYGNIKTLILQLAEESGIDVDSKRKELDKIYGNPENGLTKSQYENTDMEKELVAHLGVELKIFDDAFLERMQNTHPTLLDRLGELLDKLFRRSNLNSQRKLLLEVQDKLVKAQRKESYKPPYQVKMSENRAAKVQKSKENFRKHYNGSTEEGRRTYEDEIKYLINLDKKNVALHDIEAMHFMLMNLDSQAKAALGNSEHIDNVTDEARKKSYNDAVDYMSKIIGEMQEIGIENHNIISSLSKDTIIRITEEGYSDIYNSLPTYIKKKHPNGIHIGQAEINAITECMNVLAGKGSTRRTEKERERAVAKMQTALSKKVPPTIGKRLQAYQRTNLLFNPKTLVVRNVLSNLGAAMVNVPGDMVSSVVDSIVSQKCKTQRTTGASMKGYVQAGISGTKEVIENYKLGIDQNVAAANKWVEDLGETPKTTLTIGRGDPFSDDTLFGRFMNKINRLTSVGLQAGDAFFSSAEKHKYEYNLKQVANKKRLDYWDEKTADYISKKRTWQNTNKATQMCNSFVSLLNGGKDFGIGSFVAPFIKAPVNLAIATIEYSPMGIVKTLAIDARNFKKAMDEGGNVELYQKKFVDGFGKAAAGTMLSLIALALYSAGALSGDEDDDYEVANFKKNIMGIQPYSIKIGGKSYTYDWALPIAGNTMITTDLLENWKKSSTPSEFFSMSTLVDMLVSGVDVTGSFISDQTFFSTLLELSNKETPIDKFVALCKNASSQMLPFSSLFGQITGVTDSVGRRTTGKDVEEVGDDQTLTNIKNIAKSKYPGLSKDLQPQLDAFGKELNRYSSDNFLMNIMQSFIAPGKSKNITNDDVFVELNRLYSETEDSGLVPQILDHKIQFDNQTVELNAKEYTNYQKNYGDVAYNAIKKIINSDYYKNADDETKVDMVNTAYTLASDKAKFHTLKGKGMEANELKTWEKEISQGSAIEEVAYVKSVFGEYKENGIELVRTATAYGIDPKTYSENLTNLNSLQSDHYDDTGKESRTPHPELGKYPKWYKVAAEIDKMDVSDGVKNMYFKSIYPKSSRTSGRYKARKYFSWVNVSN